MKSFFKRSAISIIVLGVTSSTFAAVSNSNNGWSPHFSGVFIGVEGLNLRPMNGDLDYVTVDPTGNYGSYNNNAISTSYDWSWRVFGGIKFTENDDLTLSWLSMSTSDNSSTSPAGNGIVTSAPRFIGGNNNWNNVSGHVTFDLDDAYAVWGHTINFNNPWSVRYAAGLEYAKLHSKLRVVSNIIYENGDIGYEAKNDTKGFGPRVEFDMTYHLPYGFALFGNANAALLVGTRDISIDPTVVNSHDSRSDITYTNYPTDFSDRHIVIPKFGMRLGASYTYVWGQAGAEGVPCRTTTLTIDAGWQVESYIHAIERPDQGFFDVTGVDVGNQLAPSMSIDSFATTRTSNFADQGLFIGLTLGSNWL